MRAQEVRSSASPNSSSWALSYPSRGEALPVSSRTLGSPSLAAEQHRQDELFVRRELEAVEDRTGRQVLRLQEQMERFIDMMMHPLESKVASLEGKQPALDVSLGEMRGNLRGLKDSVEMQVKRADQVEIGLRKWRKAVEDDLQAACTDLAKKLSEGRQAPSEMVTRTELVDVADMLKLELKKLVGEIPSGDMLKLELKKLVGEIPSADVVTRKELATVASYLREELASVERVAAAAFNTPAHKELTSAAEAVRSEMRNLVAREGSGSFALAQNAGGEDLHRSIDDLAERLARSEQMLEETRLDVRQFQKDIQIELRSLIETKVSILSDRPLDEHGAELFLTSVGLDMGSQEAQVTELASRLQALEEQQRNFCAEISLRETSWERGKLIAVVEVPIATSEHTVSIVSNGPQATTDLTSRIHALEEQQHNLQATTDLPSRIHALEEQQHSLQALSQQNTCLGSRMASRIHAWEDLNTDLASRIHALEEQQHSLLRASTRQASWPVRESSETRDGDRQMSDSQLMLLDLNRRVSVLEQVDNDLSPEGLDSKICLREASSVLGATTVSTLKDVAELAQKLALDLQLARRTAGGMMSETGGTQSPHLLCETAGHAEDQHDCLPPVAAMKVKLSSRLQELDIRFQLKPDISESFPSDTTSFCIELRAEVAAVWDAISELADELASSGSGVGDREEAVGIMTKAAAGAEARIKLAEQEALSKIASEEATRKKTLDIEEESLRQKVEALEHIKIALEEEDTGKKAAEDDMKRIVADEEEIRKKTTDIMTRAADGAETRIKLAEQEALRRIAEEEAQRRVAEADKHNKMALEEAEARKKATEDEMERKAAYEEEIREKATVIMMQAADGAEARIKQAEQETLCRIAAEEAAIKKALEEEAETKRRAGEEQKEEGELRRKAIEQDETKRQAAETEERRKNAFEEEETLRKHREEEAKRKTAEEEESKRETAEQEEAERRIAEAECRRKEFLEEQQARSKAAEEEDKLREKAAEHEEFERKAAEAKELRKKACEEEEAKRRTAEKEESRRKAVEREEAERRTAEAENLRKKLLEEEQVRSKVAEEEEAIKKAMEEEETRTKAIREEEKDEEGDDDEQDEEEARKRKRELQMTDEPRKVSEEDAVMKFVNVSEDETVSEDDKSKKEKPSKSQTPRKDSQRQIRRSLTPTSPSRPLGSLTLKFVPTELPLQLLHVRRANHKTEVTEVPVTKESMNHGDCYVLCDEKNIYTWMGDESSPFEKNACAIHAENLARDHHGQVVEPDARFWLLLGGEGPISPAED